MSRKGVTWRDFSGMSDLEKSILTLLIDIHEVYEYGKIVFSKKQLCEN